MRIRISILISALLLLWLPACFYSDTEMYYVDPIAGDPPLVTVSTSLDSLHNPPVNDSLEVEYLVEINGGELYYVYAEIASSMVFESDSTQGMFWITPFMADPFEIDTLHMRFYYSSNTNSLADKLGYEALVKYLDFALDFNAGGAR